MKNSNPSRNDVAALAGVSTATVSRCFNNPERVSKEKVLLVKEASEKLGYTPNKLASGLRRGSSTILMIDEADDFQEITWRFFSWYWAQAVRSVQEVINDSLFHFELGSISNATDLSVILKKTQWSGIIINSLKNEECLQLIQSQDIPYVYCGRDCISPSYNRCWADNSLGGTLAGKALKKAGLSNPVYLTSLINNGKTTHQLERLEGFRKVFPQCQILESKVTESDVAFAIPTLARWLKEKKVDSVFTYNSQFGVQLILALQKIGIVIPKDLALISYDNSPLYESLPVRVTLIDNRVEEVFHKGAALLIESIKSKGKIDHCFSPLLIEGNSI